MDKLYYDRENKKFYVKELNTEKYGDILVATDEQYVDVTDEIVTLIQEHVTKDGKQVLCFDTTTPQSLSLRPQPKRDCKDCAMFLNGKCTKPHWKPSKEQMEALNEIINTLAASKHPHESDYIFNMLNGLRKNLKKL